MSSADAGVRLDLVLAKLAELWDVPIDVAPPVIVLGPLPWAGSSRPAESSVAWLTWGDGQGFWIPAPDPQVPGDGPSPLYRHAGGHYVLPTIRLIEDSDKDESFSVEYVTAEQWLSDALTRWRFLCAGRATQQPEAVSVSDWIATQKLTPPMAARLLAGLIRFALFGSDRPCMLSGLRFSACPMWLRPVDGNALARRAASHLVITARLRSGTNGTLLPNSDVRAGRYRLAPAHPQDWGVDPVHTPEGGDIRMTGRLGLGVTIGPDRRLRHKLPKSSETSEVFPPLGPSSARLPFANFNDPRRLLMAAAMQTQAIPVCGQQSPRVRRPGAEDDAPGTNLRVGYLAWQGLNHEDA